MKNNYLVKKLTNFRKIFSNYYFQTCEIVPKVVLTDDIVFDNFSAPFLKALLESAETLLRLRLLHPFSGVRGSDFPFEVESLLAKLYGHSWSKRSCSLCREFLDSFGSSTLLFADRADRWKVKEMLLESGLIFNSRIIPLRS